MGNYRKSQELQNGAHFRVIRTMLRELADQENFNINDYDLQHLCVFESTGPDLVGTNVFFKNTYLNQSCFVSDNNYETIEAPSKKNSIYSPFGKFLVLYRNHTTYFDGTKANFYILTEKTVKNDRSITYYVFGYYNLDHADTHSASFTKFRKAYECVDGGKKLLNGSSIADPKKLREQFYRMMRDSNYKPSNYNSNVVSKVPVKRYRKKKN